MKLFGDDPLGLRREEDSVGAWPDGTRGGKSQADYAEMLVAETTRRVLEGVRALLNEAPK